MSAVIEAKQSDLPAPVARRGITEAQWRTAMNNLFPGAKAESVLMVFDYCAARKLDPLKKPCHIVPMKVKDANGDYVWRDVVMPGIYEYRTTAQRTGQYLGHSVPSFGPEAECFGTKAPEWCDLTVYRWNSEARLKAEFPVRVRFSEVCGTNNGMANARWQKAPQQMLTKCAEAAALREAFPDELGGTHVEEEMVGQMIDAEPETVAKGRIDPRGDLSRVDWEKRDEWVATITDVLAMDADEYAIADKLRELDAELCKFDTLYITVCDKLAAERICSKAKWKEWLRLKRPEDRAERAHG